MFETLDQYPKFGSGIGLHRVTELWQKLARSLPKGEAAYIKVTGSNGKGSTCAIIDHILRQLALNTGCFTSPHLFHFNERILTNGQAIKDSELQQAFEAVHTQAANWQPQAEQFGAFEIYTLMARYHFQKHKALHGVFEVGIGGRYDPVRTLPGLICALTSLDLEHTSLLGDTLEKIAYDKLDLCPPNGHMVLFPGLVPDLRRRIQAYADLKQITLYTADQMCRITKLRTTTTGYRFDAELGEWSLPDLRLNLYGTHQINNALVALTSLYLYAKCHLPKISTAELQQAIRAGLQTVKLAGRAATIPGTPAFYYDVGHTPEAVTCFAKWLSTHLDDNDETPHVTLVLGISADKELQAIATPLCNIADHVICTQASQRSAPADQIAATVTGINAALPCQQLDNLAEAIAAARTHALENDGVVVCAGGLFLAIEAAQLWQNGELAELKTNDRNL